MKTLLILTALVAFCYATPIDADEEVDPCAVGWKKIGLACYLFVKQRVTWHEAFEKCGKHGAQLATPGNAVENSAIGVVAHEKSLYYPWIGAYRRLDKTFTTLCGSDPSFTNWNSSQPDDYAGRENCVQIIATNKLAKWNDNVCGKKYDYICEIKIPSKTNPVANNWKQIGRACYLFVKQRVTWNEAFGQCAKRGAQLAIPGNAAENSAIGNAANKEGLYFPWIGIYRRLDKTFTNVCGSDPSFTDWKSNQPDDYAGQENCVQIIATNKLAKWNDNVCRKKYDYICEINIQLNF